MKSRSGSGEPWHVVEGKRGQGLLDSGDARQAAAVFESILARLGDAPSYGRAVTLERLARCRHLDGQATVAIEMYRDALAVLGRLPPGDGVKGLRGTVRSELGDAFRAIGRYDDAKAAYEAALKIAQESDDRRSQALEQTRLGSLALGAGHVQEAIAYHQSALTLCQQLQEPRTEALAWAGLARVFEQSGEWDEAERHYREAIRIDREHDGAAQLGRHVNALGDMLLRQPHRATDGRLLIEESLRIAQAVDPAGGDVWRTFGTLAHAFEREAAAASDEGQKAAMLARARGYRHLHEYAPRLLMTLAGLPAEAFESRAVVFERLGRCFRMAGQPDIAIASLGEGLKAAERVTRNDRGTALRGTLRAALGEMLHAAGRHSDARVQDAAADSLPDPQESRSPSENLSDLAVTVFDDVTIDYVFGTDLLIDGARERRTIPRVDDMPPVANHIRPAMTPGTRLWMEGDTIVLSLSATEPFVEEATGCTVIQRTSREIRIAANLAVVWHLMRHMDGVATVEDLLSTMAIETRPDAGRLLAALAAVGAVDVTGRAIGRFLHRATKKGVLPAGGLASDEVLDLASDGGYREYPRAPRFPIGRSVPQRLQPLYRLTRERRSSRDYAGAAIARADLDALLDCACGITGALRWKGRDVKLRAYPSSGALYAVEIYPVALRVDGLDAAVYHYRVTSGELELVRRLEPVRLVEAALPVEREMVAGAAAMLCLTGVFSRHERKYGEGGYRMLIAEAGHISQNLLLTAQALGLSARPFGGVFDDLVNQALGVDGADEQFLLAVLVGRQVAERHGR
jgi:SagB-type dehydrogenase family enzyme